jgi:hypothetical protein
VKIKLIIPLIPFLIVVTNNAMDAIQENTKKRISENIEHMNPQELSWQLSTLLLPIGINPEPLKKTETEALDFQTFIDMNNEYKNAHDSFCKKVDDARQLQKYIQNYDYKIIRTFTKEKPELMQNFVQNKTFIIEKKLQAITKHAEVDTTETINTTGRRLESWMKFYNAGIYISAFVALYGAFTYLTSKNFSATYNGISALGAGSYGVYKFFAYKKDHTFLSTAYTKCIMQ